MQYLKNNTEGLKNRANSKEQKEFDLDRKRDDESIIDVQSLKDPWYQTEKKTITFYDTEEIELLQNIDSSQIKQRWEYEGELHLILQKSKQNKSRYWKSLEKEGTVKNKVQTWWEKYDEHSENVEDLRIAERKAGLLQ